MKITTKTKVSTRVAVITIVAVAFGIGLISYGFIIGYIQINPNPILSLPEVCNNGIDDDKDGFIDCKDKSDCLGKVTSCPDCKGISVTSDVGKDYYNWLVAAVYFKKQDLIRYSIKNTNTNSACTLTLKSSSFILRKKNDTLNRWEVKDINFYKYSGEVQQVKLAGPVSCAKEIASCKYTWPISNIALKPGETVNLRVQGDVTQGLPGNQYINFATNGQEYGFETLTATDDRGVEYKNTTTLEGIRLELLKMPPSIAL